MAEVSNSKKYTGRIAAVIIIVAAAALGLFVLWKNNVNPRTDDANVIANYIGIAPDVDGRIISLPVRDKCFQRLISRRAWRS